MTFRLMRRLALRALVCVTATAACSVAWSHATLTASAPADGAVLAETPDEIRLWFDESISPEFSSAQLLNTSAEPLEINGLRTDPDDPKLLIIEPGELPVGVYSVLARTLSEADGHISTTFLVFGVGEGVDLGSATVVETAAPVAMPEVVLRWLNFGLLAALIGALAIVALILLPLAKAEQPPHDGTTVAALAGAKRRVLGLAFACNAAALVVGLGLLAWQALALMASLPEGVSFAAVVWQVLSRTRWGAIWLAREALLLVLLIVLAYLRHRRKPEEDAATLAGLSSPAWLAGGLCVALLGAQALTGHAAAVSPGMALAVAADFVHLAAASVWVGGIAALTAGFWPLMRAQRSELRALAWAGWGAFGWCAAISVALLFATGLFNMSRQVASLDAAISTLFGQVLLGKIGLVLAMGVVGAVNSMLLHPAVAAPVARLLGRRRGWTPCSVDRLPRLVVVEAAIGLMVLLVTGVITSAEAPRGPQYTVTREAPTELSRTADDMSVSLLVKPNRPGQNVFTIFAASQQRPPPAEIARVLLRFTYLDQDVGRQSVTAEQLEPDRFLIGGNHLNLAGRWRIDAVVRRKGLEDAVAQFDWVVLPPGNIRPVIVSRYAWGPLLSLVAAGMLLIVSVLIALAARPRAGAEHGAQKEQHDTHEEVGHDESHNETPVPLAYRRA